MTKRNKQHKVAAFVESDDDTSSSTSTVRSDNVSLSGFEDIDINKDFGLEHALDALYEKRGSIRERALTTIIEAFNTNIQDQFAETMFATMLHQCLNSIKKGSIQETALASHAIGLLALTIGSGDNAREILEESVTVISHALKSNPEPSKAVALLESLAIVTFVSRYDPSETYRSMQILWQSVHPKVLAAKPSPIVTAAMVSSWAFLLTVLDDLTLPRDWKELILYFSGLLDKDDRLVRIAAGETLALIFEIGDAKKNRSASKYTTVSEDEAGYEQGGLEHVRVLKGKILSQAGYLSSEAGGKGSTKKDLNSQRNVFKDVLEFLEEGHCPEISTKICGSTFQTSSWSQLIQFNFLKRFLGGGFVCHMQDNEFLHNVLGFSPKRNHETTEYGISNSQKRMYRSPNSVLSKARTQAMNKQRAVAREKHFGRFSATDEDEF